MGDFKYSCLEEFLHVEKEMYRNAPIFYVVEYLCRFQKNPGLTEKLMKQGFVDYLRDPFWLKARNGMFNWNKPDVYSSLGLNKGTLRGLKKRDKKEIFDAQLREVYGLTASNARYLSERVFYNEDIRVLTQRVKKLGNNGANRQIKYLRKQRVAYLSDYDDYLRQLRELNMPLSDDNLYPHNFADAHQALTAEINRRANAPKIAAAKREQKKFRKKYQKLLKDLYYSNGEFIIRPAEGDAELLEESNVLSHCVYTNYRDKYRSLKTIICVIRKKEKPEQPFYTLELSPDYTRMVQCRGKGNRGATPEVEAFWKKWFENINIQKEKEECRKTA
jgi:hypothetical protein